MPWICSCGITNFAANKACPFCKERRPSLPYLTEQYINSEWRELFSWRNEMKPNKSQEEIYELHSKFFNDEAELIKGFNYEQIEDRIIELEKIAFEAKAKLSAATQKQREMKSTLDKDNRDKLIDHPSILVTDSIQAVKKRAARMTLAEKLVEDMKKAGMSDEVIAAMMVDVKVDAPEVGKLAKVIKASFNGQKKVEVPVETKVEKEETKESKENKEPSFISGLFDKKKEN